MCGVRSLHRPTRHSPAAAACWRSDLGPLPRPDVGPRWTRCTWREAPGDGGRGAQVLGRNCRFLQAPPGRERAPTAAAAAIRSALQGGRAKVPRPGPSCPGGALAEGHSRVAGLIPLHPRPSPSSAWGAGREAAQLLQGGRSHVQRSVSRTAPIDSCPPVSFCYPSASSHLPLTVAHRHPAHMMHPFRGRRGVGGVW